MTFRERAVGLLILGLLAFLIILPSEVKADVTSEQSYKIQDGETLWSIADKFYQDGSKWSYIASRNNIQDASNIPSGKILFIPPLSSQYAKNSDSGLIFVNPKPAGEVKGEATVSLEEAVYADLATRHYLNNVSVYSYDGKTEDAVSINPDKQWIPASTVKTFVAMYVFDQIDKGNLNLNDQVQVQSKNVVPTELVTDEFPTLQDGQYVTIDRLIRQMITQSDNTAYNVLLDALDRRSVTEFIHSLGLTNSSVGSKLNLDDNQLQYENSVPGYGINTTTASDYSLAFQLINDGKIAGSDDLLSILSAQKINNMIPYFLPKSLRIAHKTGDLDPLYHDGGIVMSPNRRYVLSIFTNTGDPKIVAHISDIVYSKNLNLVGADEKQPPLSQILPDQSLDPLVASLEKPSDVLGASTIPLPAITAADLGIKASDLAPSISPQNLPRIFIPADSRLHFIITGFQALRRVLSISPRAKDQTRLIEIEMSISEANELKSRGKLKEANEILADSQTNLLKVTKDREVGNNSSLQTTIQSLSDTRFSILGEELKNTKSNQDRAKLIKAIAGDAKKTVKDIFPLIPQAGNASNPNQKPIVGEVVGVSGNSVVVKTAGGQEIQIPNGTVKIKDAAKSASSSAIVPLGPLQSSTPSGLPSTDSLSSIKKGTTVALVGSNINGIFTPTFVLKNISKDLIAPSPVVILKVDTKKKIMVVSENGVPVQVNLTNNAVIKAQDTNVSLSSVKPGDVVVVHPEPSRTDNSNQKTVPGQVQNSQSPLPTTTKTQPQAQGQLQSPSSQAAPGNRSFSSPRTPTPTNTKNSAKPAGNAGNVIQSSSVRVIERKQDVSAPAPKPQPKQESKPQPRQESKNRR